MAIQILNGFPDIGKYQKPYISNDKIYIDYSITPIRTVYHMLKYGFCRKDVLQYIKDTTEDLENHINDMDVYLSDIYRINTFRTYETATDKTRDMLAQLPDIHTGLNRYKTSLQNMVVTYNTDKTTVDVLVHIVDDIEHMTKAVANYMNMYRKYYQRDDEAL